MEELRGERRRTKTQTKVGDLYQRTEAEACLHSPPPPPPAAPRPVPGLSPGSGPGESGKLSGNRGGRNELHRLAYSSAQDTAMLLSPKC